MSPHGVLPPQLVNQVIDELGKAYHCDRVQCPHCATLRACTLVSKKWSARSRAHIFKKVKIHEDKDQPTITPPASILPYVKELEVYYGCWPIQAASIPDCLKAFVAAPIECLRITGGVLGDKRACIQECIDAHSATLQVVEFQYCLISAYNFSDIVLGRHRLRSLRLAGCKCKELPPPGHSLTTDKIDPVMCSKPLELDLSISGGDPEEGPVSIETMVARLPYRFSRLDVDHVTAGDGATKATNALIKANADVLSSLCVHIYAEDMEVDVRPEHLFSLEDCSNLSELTLDMERSESHAIQDSFFILSTLNPVRSDHLAKIALEARYVYRWFNEGSRVEDEDEDEDGGVSNKKVWEGLDTVLSRLAKASISAREKRLTFTFVVMEWSGSKEFVSTVRKCLPKLLPRFNELGLLHVHYGQGSWCRAVDDSCLGHDKPDCLREDF
ncbi:hypothetical protein BDM02DRAFT_1702847 [Thelephora ganbajun]|uniref:Uncharacterized protein n=1 Tax=Thelephora ganbajun TaxID=370292 RepID=A0ACB6ZK10_THEGA|nr:hypothetical protein BDM02DRAFT_1702847 [Thelephora ganbajun]